jgi:hypothetical protein
MNGSVHFFFVLLARLAADRKLLIIDRDFDLVFLEAGYLSA